MNKGGLVDAVAKIVCSKKEAEAAVNCVLDSIAKALESVLKQETKYPYEIWLCEDCSTDGTLMICNDYAKRYPDKIKNSGI